MKYLVSLMVLILVSSASYAGWSGGERVLNKVRVVDGDIITIGAANSDFGNSGCDNSSFAVIQQDDPGADKKLSLALAAYMSGKKVGTYFSGCIDTVWGYTAPHLLTIYVVD